MMIFDAIKKRAKEFVERAKAKYGENNVEHTPQKEEPAKTMRYEHQVALNQLLKTIATCPMDQELKMILRFRIWGAKPEVFRPLDYAEIAAIANVKTSNMTFRQIMACIQERVKDVTEKQIQSIKKAEADALWNIDQFLGRSDIVTISDKFLKDGGIKGMMNPEKRIIV